MIAPLIYRAQIRKQIHQLKYQQRSDLARVLVQTVANDFASASLDALLPVPLHRQRLRERGFNQALEIAQALSQRLQIPVVSNVLSRSRATLPQTGLSPAQRQSNTRGAFEIQQCGELKRVAIVDDVITSGSTMRELTRMCQRSGVTYVEVWSLARALRDK